MGFFAHCKTLPPKREKLLKTLVFSIIGIAFCCLLLDIITISMEDVQIIKTIHFMVFIILAIWAYNSKIKLAGDIEVSLGYAISFVGAIIFGYETAAPIIFMATITPFLLSLLKAKKIDWVKMLVDAGKNLLIVNLIGILFLLYQHHNFFATLLISLFIPFIFDISITGMIASLCISKIPYKDRYDFMDYLVRNFGIGSRQYLLTPFIGFFIVWAYQTNTTFLLFSIFTAYVVNLQLKNRQEKIEAIRKLTRFAIELIYQYDQTTGSHSDRVHAFTLMICAKLKKSAWFSRMVGLAAALHDLGKIGVSQEIINKAGKPTDEEFEKIKSHTLLTAELVGLLPLIPDCVALWASLHHEKVNGGGYPYGLTGDQIPEASLIIAVADVIDALIAERQYKRGWPIEKVIEAIVQGTGRHFDDKYSRIGAEVLCEIAAKGTARTFMLEKEIIDF